MLLSSEHYTDQINRDMDKLSDDLLVEIFCRLPYKMAVRCKSISKRFLALISQHSFIERSIHHHHTLLQHMKDEKREREWHLHPLSRRKLLVLFLPNIHDLSNPQNQLSLSFLGSKFQPKCDDQTKSKRPNYTSIVGCSNGLFLCRRSPREKLYFVCNPVTKESLKVLPLAPPLNDNIPLSRNNKNDRVLDGFICEPYYNVEGNGSRVSIVEGHRFRVVRFPFFEGTVSEFLHGITKSEFEMVVFSSETGQWITKLVSCTKGSSFTQATVFVPPVAHGGKLYFVGKVSLLEYDPFGNDRECDIIDYPSDSYPRDIPFTGHVGVSCGNIRLCAFSSPFTAPRCVSVWELKPDNDWCLIHKTCLPPNDIASSVRPELAAGQAYEYVGFGVRVRAFHPHHGDVVLFQYAHRLFIGNLKTDQFHTAGYGIHGFYGLQIISLDLPFWPTPVPSIR